MIYGHVPMTHPATSSALIWGTISHTVSRFITTSLRSLASPFFVMNMSKFLFTRRFYLFLCLNEGCIYPACSSTLQLLQQQIGKLQSITEIVLLLATSTDFHQQFQYELEHLREEVTMGSRVLLPNCLFSGKCFMTDFNH